MGLWSSLFGTKSESFAEKEHINLFTEFTNRSIRSWTEAERYVESHPELLRDDTLATIAGFVVALVDTDMKGVVDDGRRMKEQFATRVNLLIRCREVGISRAFDEIRMNAAH